MKALDHTRTDKVVFYLVQQAGLGNETSGFCLRGQSRKRDLSPNAAVATGSQCVCVCVCVCVSK